MKNLSPNEETIENGQQKVEWKKEMKKKKKERKKEGPWRWKGKSTLG